ncbi:MAG: tellurite resistance TerB family protein [Thiotrichales bacterium]
MDTRALLDQLLQSGQSLLKQGQGMAEDKLKIPEAGPERDAMLSGLGKGALAAGALALLLGTKSGRKVTGTGLKLGSLAALGGLAYKTYRDWESQRGTAATTAAQPINELSGPSADRRSRALLAAMIAAAKADGHIDAGERSKINAQMAQLGLQPEALQAVQAELDGPANAATIAANADNPEAAAEIYLVSLLVIDLDNPDERAYLDQLADALKLDPQLAAQLELQAAQLA